MISPDEALQRILDTVPVHQPVRLPLEQALGGFLAEDVTAPFGLPLFDNSAMDGYAVRSADLQGAAPASPVSLQQIATVAAGDNPAAPGASPLASGQAIQIFTGAMIPPGADAVIRQEDVTVHQSTVTITAPVKPGANIRRAGEEVTTGDCVLHAGTAITPAAIGLLASFGLREIHIAQRPCVGCVVTGSELMPAGSNLEPGQIYDSNSAMLCSAVAELGLTVGFRARSADHRNALLGTIESALSACDVLILSGGVSVGAYDFVKDAAAAAGIEQIFWKVAQKPGKPVYFGANASRAKFLFGLPGNPASALVCFYEYVRPALRKMMGAAMPQALTLPATLDADFHKRPGLTHFLKGHLHSSGTVTILEAQGSHMMSSFARANCLVKIPADITDLEKGARVELSLVTP